VSVCVGAKASPSSSPAPITGGRRGPYSTPIRARRLQGGLPVTASAGALQALYCRRVTAPFRHNSSLRLNVIFMGPRRLAGTVAPRSGR